MQKQIGTTAILVLAMVWGGGLLFADQVARQAQITSLSGQVEWLKAGSAEWEAASPDQKLSGGDKIRTGEQSEATITLDDSSTIQLSPDTEFSISTLTKDTATEQLQSVIALLKGRVKATVTPLQSGSRFDVETPTVVAAVRGTTLNVGINPDGSVSVSSEDDVVDLIREGENKFTAKLETGEEALIEVDPITGTVKVTAVKGSFDVIGPDGTVHSLAEGDAVVFGQGPATFIPANNPIEDAPAANTITETSSGS